MELELFRELLFMYSEEKRFCIILPSSAEVTFQTKFGLSASSFCQCSILEVALDWSMAIVLSEYAGFALVMK